MRGRSKSTKPPSDRFSPPAPISEPNDRPGPPKNDAIPGAPAPNTTSDQADFLTKNNSGQPAFGNTATNNPAAVNPNTEFAPSQADRVPAFGNAPLGNSGRPANIDNNSFQPALEEPKGFSPKPLDKDNQFAPNPDLVGRQENRNFEPAALPNNNSFKMERMLPPEDLAAKMLLLDPQVAARKSRGCSGRRWPARRWIAAISSVPSG